MREYSREFDEADFNKRNQANRAVIEQRRRLLEEWRAWRARVKEQLKAEGIDTMTAMDSKAEESAGETVEEIVEEIVEETEEIVP